MQKRLSRAVVLAFCAAIVSLLLACGTNPGDEKWSYHICQDTDQGKVCHYEYMSRDECNAKYGPGICG